MGGGATDCKARRGLVGVQGGDMLEGLHSEAHSGSRAPGPEHQKGAL